LEIGGASVRILVVEDEAVLANAIVAALQIEFGGSVDLARDGRQAVELIDSQAYDVVVLDRTIPPPTGLQLLRLWGERSEHPPVLMLSAWDTDHDRAEALASGADDYLTKPFSIAELRSRVQRLIEQGSRPSQPLTAAGTRSRPGQ